MSDRVQEIIEELILTAPLDDIPSEEDRVNAAKQIRQQIGKELLENTHLCMGRVVSLKKVREVCQMEDE